MTELKGHERIAFCSLHQGKVKSTEGREVKSENKAGKKNVR